MARDIFRKLHTQQGSNAKQRGIPFELSLEEWKSTWIDSGKWTERGRGKGKYCMCRVADQGAYAVDNVYIGLSTDNIRDGNVGKIVSDTTRALISASNMGKKCPWSAGKNNPMHRAEAKAKMSEAISGWKHYKAKMTQTPVASFLSATDAANALGVKVVTVNWRCKHNYQGQWAYI